MVALLTGLQLKLNLRSFRGNVGKTVGLVILSLYALGVLIAILVGMTYLRVEEPFLIGLSTTIFMAVATIVWPVSVVLFGASDPLSASRFALLPVTARQLRPGLLVATAMSFGGILVCLAAVGFLIGWSGNAVTFAVAVVSAVLGIAFTIVLTRALTAAISATLASRKFRDWALLMVGVIALLAAFAGQAFGAAAETGITVGLGDLMGPTTILAWTPFGWAWSLPWAFAEGQWVVFAARLALLGGSFVLLWKVWGYYLARALTSPLESSGSATKIKGHGRVDALMPSTPAGAVGARTLRYWARDPRRKVQALSALVMPVVFSFVAMTGGQMSMEALLLVPIGSVALIGLMLVASDICYDGSAIWTQIVAGTRGRDDRLGRLYGLGLVFGTFIVVMTVGFIIWVGRWDLAVLTLTGTICVTLVGAGVGSWMGAIWNYPVPPVENGMMASRGNMSALGGVLLSMLVQTAILVPLAALALGALAVPVLMWVAPVVLLAAGVLVLWGGIVLGGRYLDDHWPEVLKSITWAK